MTLAGSRRFFVLATAFLLTGAATVTLGSVLPELRRDWEVSAAQVSWLFTVQFATSSVSAVFATLHLRLSLFAGYALIGIGMLVLSGASPRTALVALALVGLGLGAVATATNLVVTLEDPVHRGAALSRVNLAWGIGATGFPALLAVLSDVVTPRQVVAGLGVFCCLAPIPLSFLKLPRTTGEAEQTAEDAVSPKRGVLLLLPFALLLFLYVGSEATFGSWLVTLAAELGTLKTSITLLVGSCFWASILVGRAVATVVLKHISEAQLYGISLATATAGAVLLLAFHRPPTVFLGAVLGGLGMASLFPLSVSLLTRFAESIGVTQTGWVFACAGLGGAVLPWLAGNLADSLDSTRYGFSVACVGLALTAALFAFVVRRVPE